MRDDRRAGWFWVDNVLIEEHGARIGAAGIAVYCALAVHTSGDDREARPSHERLATLTGLSLATVKRTLNKLHDAGLITISKQFKETAGGGKHKAPSLYTLTPLSAASNSSQGAIGQSLKSNSSQGAINNTQGNKTQQQQPITPKPAAAAAGPLTPSQTALKDLLAGFGVTANRRSLAIVRKIADKPRVLEVVREQWAQIEAGNTARNPQAVLLAAIETFDFDATPTPKPAPRTVPDFAPLEL